MPARRWQLNETLTYDFIAITVRHVYVSSIYGRVRKLAKDLKMIFEINAKIH